MNPYIEKVMKSLLMVNEIKPNMKFGDPKKWDSLSHLVLISEIMDHFQVYLTDDEVKEMTTIPGLGNVLRRHKI
jgi:acyl carrier protein